MRKFYLLVLFFALSLLFKVAAQSSGLPEVTLYSPNKYEHSFKRALFNFEIGKLTQSQEAWDLNYGSIYIGDDYDWFESSTAQGNWSVIRDLGALLWTTDFKVPVVDPLPKLKPGEQRHITVDASGADGADGKPGSPGRPGIDGEPSASTRFPNNDAQVLDATSSVTTDATAQSKSSRPKNDGKSKVDPLFVKAIVGHIYVIHVVDETRDYYALFRVEVLQRGDNCTISWKLIPAPEREISNQKR